MNQIKIQQKVQIKEPLIPHGSIATISWDAKRSGCVFAKVYKVLSQGESLHLGYSHSFYHGDHLEGRILSKAFSKNMKSIWLLHQTLKIRLFFKNICYGSLQYAFYYYYLFTITFKKISLDSKDKTFAKIYLCAFSDGGARLSRVQKHRFWDNKKHFWLLWNHWGALRNGGKNPTKFHWSWRTPLVFPHFATPISQSFKCKIICS